MRFRSVTAAVSGLAVALTGVATLGPVSPAAAEPVVPPAVAAAPRAEVLGIDAVNVGGLVSVADVAVGVSRTTVAGAASNAYASNLETSLLGTDLPSILARVDQSAPPDNATPMVAGGRSGALAPLLTLGVSESAAHARSAPTGLSCVAPGTPVAGSSVATANVRLLDVPLVGALLELPGTASTTSTTELVPNAATDVDGRDVVATAAGSTAVVKLLGGNVEISVNDAPSLVATATGRPGGAEVAYDAPLVTVKVGSRTVRLDADGSPTDISLPAPLSTLVDLDISLGQLEDVVESADGTTASASAAVLHVDATLLAGAVRLLDLDLFPLTASAEAPVGGAECPGIDRPAVTRPTDGAVTNDATPEVSGTGEPGQTVTVVIDGTVRGTAPVGGDGRWTFTPGAPLAEGPHTVTGAYGGLTSPEVDFTVDVTADAAPVILTPPDGSVTTDTTPDVTGTGVPGSEVEVSVDGVPVGTTTVGDDGRWTVPVTSPLGDGTHTVEATQTDPAGNTSPADAVDVTVDTATPGAPVVTAPTDGSAVRDTTPDVTGTGEPGATVTVEIDGTVVGTDVVGTDGTWSVTPGTPLGEGPHTVEATQTDPAGNTSPADAVDFTVDTTAPDAPVITAPTDGATLETSPPAVTGTGEAGATVTVTVDGRPVGSTQVGTDGRWSLAPRTPLAPGRRVVAATQADRAGNVSAADSVTVTVRENPDIDGDGLPNDEETRIGTDPRNPDTDGDGLTDGAEVLRHGTDPLDRDSDDDRLTDGQEVLTHRTNPLNPDTDRDGLGDGHEVRETGTRPQFADTDNDGLGDGAELIGFRMNQGVVYRPNRAYRLDLVRTNPLRKDTDGDGLQDRTEVYGVTINQNVRLVRGSYVIGLRKSDPNHPDTDRDGLTDAQEVTGSANARFGRRKTDPTHFDTDRGGRMDGEEVQGRFDPSDAYSGPNSGR
ncbi:Ig-like domain-containing protein [Nocardioides alkalitolerans]|uniref:Ig-like domain-containing protein n=1 Tax=Nocardioides alkalitolerans TaxID=281714 RepID=UPI000408326B|nr:Ig-like domain-containing protein [Nocardioides alkalitolerans]